MGLIIIIISIIIIIIMIIIIIAIIIIIIIIIIIDIIIFVSISDTGTVGWVYCQHPLSRPRIQGGSPRGVSSVEWRHQCSVYPGSRPCSSCGPQRYRWTQVHVSNVRSGHAQYTTKRFV